MKYCIGIGVTLKVHYATFVRAYKQTKRQLFMQEIAQLFGRTNMNLTE